MGMNADLIIPVYLDTNALLDLLASIEGGFSVVEKITTRDTRSKAAETSGQAEAGTEFGIPNVLSLLKVKLAGTLGSKRSQENIQETEAARYHTYGSLLYRLRTYLDEQHAIKRFEADKATWETVHPSDFVEVHGVFRPNPLAYSLEVIDRLAGLAAAFGGIQPGMQSARGKTAKPPTLAGGHDQQLSQVRRFLKDVLADIQREKVRTFVVDLGYPPSHRAVALLFSDYLRDQTMSEISHKEYRLLGKVVRKLDSDSPERIELLRGTGLGGFSKSVIDSIIAGLGSAEGMNLPEVQVDIAGPALEMVPIAVFV
jgi:hypothetical protein